ncbi:MAG: DEAD/DEAH box helicase [Gammaproteobacteria bacterium]
MPTSTKKSPRKRKTKKASSQPRVSRTRQPEGLGIEEWQVALRRQYGREQNFALLNTGEEPVFSDFIITNPQTRREYRVAIRGSGLGENFCGCPDFATNELGTCKHIEFTLARLARRRGGKSALRRGYQPNYSELWLEYGARRQVRFRPGKRCPKPVLAAAQQCFDAADQWLMSADKFAELDAFVQAARDSRHELRACDDALEFVANARRDQERQRILDVVYPQGATSPRLRDLVNVSLYPYQAEGALFAARAGRALIADDMGLGKTVQAIAGAEILLQHVNAQRVLVICPASLKHQWKQEVTRFTGRQVTIVGGPVRARAEQFASPATYMVMNYDTLQRDRSLVAAWAPDLVIADEAQRIKNWDTVTARTLKQLVSPYAFVLTGTPLENRLEEVLSIVQFVDRHRLGPTWRFRDEHQLYDEVGRVVGYRDLDRIGQTLAPIMIRRRKADVLHQLPPRAEKRYFVALTNEQQDVHDSYQKLVAQIVAKWRRQRFLSDKDQKRLLAMMQNMRMVCNSTYLLDGATDSGRKIPELVKALLDLLQQPEAKVVIFSQWLRTHELMRRAFDARGWRYVLFHGGVPTAKRGALIEQFRDDPQCRLFLSTDAGGVGLNLQHANVVINMDMPWNPAVLEQRIGRVHRMGQQKPVQILNFIAEDSIEHGMLSLLGFKQALFAGVLDGGDTEVHLEGTRLTRFMKSVERVTSPAAVADNGIGASPTVAAPTAAPQPPPNPATENPWQPLLELGQQFVSSFVERARGTDEAGNGSTHHWIDKNPETGQPYLRIPVPDPQTVSRLADALGAVLKSMDNQR